MTARTRNRAVPILIVIAAVLAVAVAVTVAFAFNRTPDPSAAPEPSAPEAAPDAKPEDPAVSEIAFEERGFALIDDDGTTVLEYDWQHEPTETVAALTEAFGSEPTVGLIEGDGSHFPDYTVWEWPGFALASMIESEDGKPREEYARASYVTLTATAVGDVTLTPEFGLWVGMPVDEARAAGPDLEEDHRDDAGGGLWLVYGKDRVDPDLVLPPYSVFAETGPDGATIERIEYDVWSEL